MDNLQIAYYMARLTHEDTDVRRSTINELGETGVAAVPVLTQALKNRSRLVRRYAADALGNVGDATAVSALVEALQDEFSLVRWSAAEALWKIGDLVSLPRKILAASRFSALERTEILDRLRQVRGYKFDDTRTLCQKVLNEGDLEARLGAQTVFNWLNGERELLLASMPAAPTNDKNLLVAYQGGTAETRPATLLLPSNEPEEDIPSFQPQPSRWKQWFGKRK